MRSQRRAAANRRSAGKTACSSVWKKAITPISDASHVHTSFIASSTNTTTTILLWTLSVFSACYLDLFSLFVGGGVSNAWEDGRCVCKHAHHSPDQAAGIDVKEKKMDFGGTITSVCGGCQSPEVWIYGQEMWGSFCRFSDLWNLSLRWKS